jgi:peptide methionine sulfoxide reductase MsrA
MTAANDAAPDPSGRREVATLAGGCFWCLTASAA